MNYPNDELPSLMSEDPPGENFRKGMSGESAELSLQEGYNEEKWIRQLLFSNRKVVWMVQESPWQPLLLVELPLLPQPWHHRDPRRTRMMALTRHSSKMTVKLA